jgi:hypothetical protein
MSVWQSVERFVGDGRARLGRELVGVVGSKGVIPELSFDWSLFTVICKLL